MANTYYDKTGVLIFDGEPKVTPILLALFDTYELNPGEVRAADFPSNQHQIREIAEDTDVSWQNVALSISRHASAIGVSLPDGAEETDMAQWLIVLARKFGVTDGVCRRLAEADQFDGDAPVADLYDLAMQFRDGHNLVSVATEAGWHSDQERLYGFGGHGAFYGPHLRIRTDSSTARQLGAQINDALTKGDYAEAGELLADSVIEMLAGVTEEWEMVQVRHYLTRAIASGRSARTLTPDTQNA
ncbi:hypothetical protein [Burkholderia sp. Ac-20365]|uniref:hypothetical protein n=1 Tax=Burkholderia sp. Ac-20365 TaxID=2703897 RepID=UPI00197BBB8C|nr:hypothetical protein [Burkholderia sp. Ac-20365]MBN3760882.1 hypothetical protein [Burkholderia sp. Ac-20365]